MCCDRDEFEPAKAEKQRTKEMVKLQPLLSTKKNAENDNITRPNLSNITSLTDLVLEVVKQNKELISQNLDIIYVFIY